ncbi:MAG: DUF1501 domain-containing protein [Fuerstiella sp.]|nr:DUF1501 domain-containing protein [Fuerstiella sp.]
MSLSAVTGRRCFLQESVLGLGSVALASLMDRRSATGARAVEANRSLTARASQFAPRAKNVIFLFMAGGPSQLELFDNKPSLRKYAGQRVPNSVLGNQELPFIERDATLMPSPLRFSRHGESGAELSEALPRLAEVVDDIAIVRSMHTDAFNHAPAQIFLHTGHLQLGKPSMGSWISYGLGSECSDLPAFVVLTTGQGVSGGASCYGNGFLPSVHQGVTLRSEGDPILFLGDPKGIDRSIQRDTIDALGHLNRHRVDIVGDPEIETRIAAYEMAFRMQTSAPDLIDVGQESKTTLELYGVTPGEPSFAGTCLLARRLVERGTRFVELMYKGWDHHSDVEGGVKKICGRADQPVAALIKDLRQRGLLDETLVVWGGEFGRTPMVEDNPALGRTRGRDHHPNAYTMWMAGGGINPGQTIGKTDELGYHVTEDPVHIHDLQATILHLLGIEHTELTFQHQGRDFRLTDVEGEIVEKLLG